MFLRVGFSLEHVQHSLGDDETTRDVDRLEQDCQRSEGLGEGVREVPSSEDEQTSHCSDA